MSLPPERWSELEPHFDALLDMNSVDRAAYLEHLGAEDSTLARDLRRLLESEASSVDWADLWERAPDLLADTARKATLTTADLGARTLGPFRIIDTLGRGGMSIVYLGERTDGKFDQRVAIKVLQWTAGRGAALRFRQEQQTLAHLQHPGMTRIFDSGTTDDGLPYFVMEYVDGKPITEHCTELQLRTRERIELFLQICDAVHTAHQNLIVHRDLKPDNVLVTADGHVKVLDFGIAKWLQGSSGATAVMHTRQGEEMFTPQYAAPEQFTGSPVTTAADIYALGLLLYELLAGAPPYDLKGKSLTEQRHLVCEGELPPLASRASSPRSRRELRDDLQIVCACALHKEPRRRYESASALAADLRRYLEGLPIVAAPDSWSYRTAKFVRRHRGAVAGASLAALTLVAATAVTAWQASVASHERDRARIETTRAQAVTDFLVDALQQANPYSSSGKDVTVRELVETSVERMDVELADQPEIRARLYATMANVFGHSGQQTRGIELGWRAVHLADSLYGKSSLESADARYQLSRNIIHRDAATAEMLVREAIEGLEQSRSPEAAPALANHYEELATAFNNRASYDSAATMHLKAIALRQAYYDEPHSDLARSHHYLGSTFSNMRDERAGEHFALAVELWRATLGADHPNEAASLNNWGYWHRRMGRPDSAAACIRRALDIDRRVLGPTRAVIAVRMLNLSRIAIDRARFDEARDWLSQAKGILAAHEPRPRTETGIESALGDVAFLRGEYDEAESHYRAGWKLMVDLAGESNPLTAALESQVGRACLLTGKALEGERLLDHSVAILRDHLPGMSQQLVAAETWRGLYVLSRDEAAGEHILRDAVALAREQLPAHDPSRGEAECTLGRHLVNRGVVEEGRLYLTAAYASLASYHGEAHPNTVRAREALERAPRL